MRKQNTTRCSSNHNECEDKTDKIEVAKELKSVLAGKQLTCEENMLASDKTVHLQKNRR